MLDMNGAHPHVLPMKVVEDKIHSPLYVLKINPSLFEAKKVFGSLT